MPTTLRQLTILGWWKSHPRWQRRVAVILVIALILALAYEQWQGYDMLPVVGVIGGYAALGGAVALVVWGAGYVQRGIERALDHLGLLEGVKRVLSVTEQTILWAVKVGIWTVLAGVLAYIAFVMLDVVSATLRSMPTSTAIVLGAVIIAWAIVSNRPR